MRHTHHPHNPAGGVYQQQALAHVQHVPDLPDLPLLPFSCMEPGCSRWGPDGFLRQVDLDEHMLVHTLLRGSVPYQPGSVAFNAPSMNNAFDRGQGFNSQQDVASQTAVNFFDDGGYGMNVAGEQENNFQQYANYGLAGHHADRVDAAGRQENDLQQHMNYAPAGDVVEYGGFQMNGVDEYGNALNDEFDFALFDKPQDLFTAYP
ncbi:hypothetical protein F4679DRAFT_563007 [Xylaria curta]|nr:hypothetical protein F4679DRAFT_563007 [Xylaria curta]